jgi:hypothetical protein
MRLIKLVPALAAAAALLALATTGASARPAAHGHASARPSGKCHLSIEAPTVMTAGEPLTVFGTLTCASASSAGVPVTVYTRAAHPGHKSALTVLTGNATTTAGGAYSITPAPPTTNTVFYAIAAGVRSRSRVVKVSPQVSLEGPSGSQLLTGGGSSRTRATNAVRFTGTVNPFEPGEVVALQRENSTGNEEWRRIDLGVVNAKGEYTITHVFGIAGDANLRVVAHPSRFNAPGASAPLSYVISQRQNPRLTINASSDPISYGQPVTITGILAGGAAKQPLTLLARTRGGAFAPVAKGETESGGAYKFTQTPLQSTAYRVQNTATSSAALFEGVKYVLGATPNASSVRAGQPLTVAGKVTPGHLGQVVYLERQNASKIGFHVVEEGIVTAVSGNEGSFTIVHAFFGPGAGVLRVAVPGNPENQGVASTPFNLEVTPAPPGSLGPFSPAKLPGNGEL